jgi:predicted dehydrogenase
MIRTGVIGVGHLGQHHARHFASLPGSKLIGVLDTDPARGTLIADRYQVRCFTALPAFLREVDAVSVAVPTSAHFAVAKSCLQAGKHVLVEKPIAVTPAEGRELVRLAKEAAYVLQVGHSERFNPIMSMVRPFITRPVFVEGHRLSPFGERGTDVDVVLDLMIHDLDMLLSFQPGPVEEIRAAGVPVLSRTVDIANVRIMFASGCVANLTSSRVSTNKMRRLRLFQRDSYVGIDYQARHAIVCRRVAAPGGRPTIDMEQFQGGDDEPLRLELEAFLRAIAEGTSPIVSGEEGTAALELAHQVLEAIGTFIQRQETSEQLLQRVAGGEQRAACNRERTDGSE